MYTELYEDLPILAGAGSIGRCRADKSGLATVVGIIGCGSGANVIEAD